MKANGIGLPEKRIIEIEPLEIPVPSLVPDFIPEWMEPEKKEEPLVPA